MSSVIRRCTETDLAQLIPFLKRTYPHNPRLTEPDYLCWQFRDTAFGRDGRYHLFLLIQDQAITGLLGYVPLSVMWDGREVEACWTCLWHAPAGSTRGIQLLAEVNRSFDYRIHIGLTEASARLYQTYRMPYLAEIPRWLAFPDPDAIADWFQAEDLKRVRSATEQFPRVVATNEAHEVDRFEDGDAFHFEAWPHIRYFVPRTAAYLNWRYREIPKHHYHLLRAGPSDFAIYREERIMDREAQGVFRIVEWHAHGNAARAILAEIIERAQKRNAVLIDFYCTAPTLGAELAAQGFVQQSELSQPIPSLFRPTHPGWPLNVALDFPPHRTARGMDFTAWCITRGDSDNDRRKK
jgi:hypothetical protein